MNWVGQPSFEGANVCAEEIGCGGVKSKSGYKILRWRHISVFDLKARRPLKQADVPCIIRLVQAEIRNANGTRCAGIQTSSDYLWKR